MIIKRVFLVNTDGSVVVSVSITVASSASVCEECILQRFKNGPRAKKIDFNNFLNAINNCEPSRNLDVYTACREAHEKFFKSIF